MFPAICYVRPCWEQNIKFEQNRTTFYYIQKYEASTKKGKGLLEWIISNTKNLNSILFDQSYKKLTA